MLSLALIHFRIPTLISKYTAVRPFHTSFAKMVAPVPAGKFEWVVIVPDFPNSLEKRLAARSTHFFNLKASVDSGYTKVGGATLSAVPTDDKLDMNGSALVVVAASKEEVIAELKKDIYATAGVWDVGNATILPFKCAVREP